MIKILIFILLAFLFFDCSSYLTAEDRMKKEHKKQEKLMAKKAAVEEKGKKHILKIQTKAVRKRMKKNLREANRNADRAN